MPMQETWIQSQGGEDPLEKEIATHSSILDWEIPWTEEPGGLQSVGSQKESDTTQATKHILLFNLFFTRILIIVQRMSGSITG